MSEDKIIIKNVKVEYMATKTDTYDNELCYFKLIDKNTDQKFESVIKENFKNPWFLSDNGTKILKVKNIYIKLKELHKDDVTLVNISFKFYKMGDVEGVYVNSLI